MDPEQKRSLQDIMPPTRRRPMRTRLEESSTEDVAEPRAKKSGKGKVVIVLALVVIFIAGISAYGLSSFFESAVVTITPRQEAIVANALVLKGTKDGQAPVLGFTIAKSEKVGVRKVEATGSASVSESARGRIIVYNNHSTTPQKLIKNTRFETTSGLVFRTPNSISVPGKTTKDGKTVPGSLEIEVVAYEAGEKYNTDLTDFTLPGLKDDERFTTVYARSVTPMSGGFIGKKAVVAKEVEDKNRSEMRVALEKEIREAAKSTIPEGYFAADSLIFTSFAAEPTKSVEGGAELREKGTAYAILLPLGPLARVLAVSLVGDYDGEEVALSNPEQLQITVDESISTPWDEESLSFEISGNGSLKWSVPMEEIKKELAGKDKGAIQTVMTGFPSVERADGVLTPFWLGSFPKDTARITVTNSEVSGDSKNAP